jgi:transcriptional regulator with XRE-family HTH domain
MKKAIEYLMFKSGISNYQISQATGISQVVLSKYATGKSDLGRMTLDNAMKLNSYYKEMLKVAEAKFGTVEHEGRTLFLQDQPEFSGRALLDWQVEEGYAHFSAPAVGDEGNEYQVEWVLKTVNENGEGIEDLGELDWDNVDKVVEI